MTKIAKAIMAGATTLGSSLTAVEVDGSLTVAKAIVIACGVIVSVAAVYATPNG